MTRFKTPSDCGTGQQIELCWQINGAVVHWIHRYQVVMGGEQHYIKLMRGLRVAYTPPDTPVDGHRLCLSRVGGKPSQLEGGAVKRPFALSFFDYDERGCFVIEWVEGEQKQLFGDPVANGAYI